MLWIIFTGMVTIALFIIFLPVLRPKGNQLHPDRQIRQAGIELFNNQNNKTAIEVISVGLEDFRIF